MFEATIMETYFYKPVDKFFFFKALIGTMRTVSLKGAEFEACFSVCFFLGVKVLSIGVLDN